MRYYRVKTSPGPRWAREEEGDIRLLTGSPWAGGQDTSETLPLEGTPLLAPAEPTKIVCIGVNYKDHAAERQKPVPAEPLLFLKPPSALIGPGEAIRHPGWVGRVDHEAEVGLVIGRIASHVQSRDEAREAIFGVVCVNDVTARELQAKDVQFTRAKGFDTFCPVGPALAVVPDLDDLTIQCRVNDVVRQSSHTRELIFPAEELVIFISRVMTLRPGDIISTGTPAGIAPLVPGDVVEVEISGVGVLRNPVV